MVSNHKPVLIVIAGPNGSGKTTVTEQILRHEWMEDAIYVNPDIIAQEMFGDWNSRDAVAKSIFYCEELREKCLKEGKSLIFETVLSRIDKVDYIRRAKEAGFFVRLFFVCTESPTINASRIARRVMQGGHDVPIRKIISRYNLSIANCVDVAKIVDRCYLYDNSAENCDARPLFRTVDGKLAKVYSGTIPEWAKIIKDCL
ncbi:MAG: zeta toxin family protein [Alistipes sp.]|nr:zeta toxin family protein [Alistipes sp.]MBR4028952.1 zeta toxin family protein [Alistipes sp.]